MSSFSSSLDKMEALELILDRAWPMAYGIWPTARPLVLKRWQPNLSLFKEDTQRKTYLRYFNDYR
jgi:hypothetical protein